MIKIRSRFDHKRILGEGDTTRSAAEGCKSNLTGAYLTGANLTGAYLTGAYLTGANLTGANLTGANLTGAYLTDADLTGAYLTGAHLTDADLTGAYLTDADLTGAYLTGAHLTGADLRGANLEFYQFPSIRLISSIYLDNLTDSLTLELMRRDADGHPNSKDFDVWAKGGQCPYQNEERMWRFCEKRELWMAGKPEMKDSDLILAICKEKNWGIRGYFKRKE